MELLRVPETEYKTFERPIYSSGRLSRIGMIPEEEFEMSSDDEISISVPHALNRKRTEMDISACVGIEHSSINYIDFNYVQPLNEQPLHNHVHSLSEKDNLNMERQRINLGGTTRSGSANEIIKQPDNSSEQSNKKTSPKHDNSVFYVTTHTLVTPSPMQQIESSGKEYAAQEQRQQFQTKSEVTQSLEKRTTGMTSLFAETNTDSNIYGELQLQALILKPNSPFTDIEKQSLREDTGASSDFKADIITPIIENENNLTNNEMEDFGRTFVKTELEDTIRNAYLDHRIESYTGHNCETDKINEEQLKTCHDIRGNASELYMDGRISRHMLHISQTHETSSNIINDSKSSCVESDETFATTIDFADRKCDLAKMDTDWNDIFLDEELLTVFSRVNTPESGEESDIEILKSDKVKQNSVRVSKISVPSITFSEASDSLTSSVSIVENSKEYIAMNEINTDESDDNSDEGTEIDGEDNDDKMEEEEEEDDDYFCDDNNTHNTDQSITDASDDDEVHSLQHERTCKHGVDNVVYSPNHTAPTNVADLSYEEVVNGSNDKSYADNGKSSSETIKATSECNTNCENPEAHRNINKTDNISKSVQNIKRHFVVAAFASMSKRKIGSQNDKINSMRTKKSERKDNSQSLRKIKLKSRVRRLQPDTEPYAVKDSETDSMDKTILIRRPDLSTHLPVVSKQAQTVSSITIQELKINTRTTKRLENTYLDKNMLVKPVAPISRSQTKLSSAKGKTGKSVNNNVTISGNNNHTKTNVLSYTHGNEYKTNRTESDKDNVFENSNKYNCTQNAEIRENAIKPSFDRRLLSMEKEIGNCPIKRCVPHTASTQFVYKKHDPAILSLRRIYQKNRPHEKANSSIDYVYTGPLQTKENSFKMRSSFRNMSTPSFLRTKSLASKKVKSEKSALVQTTSNREKNNDGQQVNHAMDVMTPKNTKYFENNDITIKNEIKDMILENVSPLTETPIRHDEMGSSQINEETTEATNSKRIVMTVDNNSDFPSTSLMTSRDVSSPFTDTARLLKIRRLLQLPSDDFQMSTHEYVDEKESYSIIQGILKEVVQSALILAKQVNQNVKSCSTTDEHGDEILGCQLLTSSNSVDPGSFSCDVIDPLDVTPVTKAHEYLISSIIRVSSENIGQVTSVNGLVIGVPIVHWYVEPWEELVIKQMDTHGNWREIDNQPEVVKINFKKVVYYGVQVSLTELGCIAVVKRPKLKQVTVSTNDQIVTSASDDRVKMKTYSSDFTKEITLQVVPVESSLIEEIQASAGEKAPNIVLSASPMLIISVKDLEPESLAFEVPYVSVLPRQWSMSPTSSHATSPNARTRPDGMSCPPAVSVRPSPYLSVPITPPATRRPSISTAIFKDPNQTAFHLVQIDGNGETKIKLLENAPTSDVARRLKPDSVKTEDKRLLKFAVYDRETRLIALETKGSLLYADVEQTTGRFIESVMKHKVKIRILQDKRNVFSLTFEAEVDHPNRQWQTENERSVSPPEEKKHEQDLFAMEGDIMAMVFRGNVDMSTKEKLVFSFHGYRGVRRHFEIKVANPMSQRSMQTYHGALQLFVYAEKRYTAFDRSLTPSVKNGWTLRAEFPLLIPKYEKTTPVMVNRAAVSIRFQEPLTVAFVRAMCSELLSDWKMFARALGISNARVQAIKQQHHNVVSEKVLMDVIITWLKTRSIAQDKVTPIINALLECNKHKLASELAHRNSCSKQVELRRTNDTALKRAFTLIAKNSGTSLRWRQIIHHLFHRDGGKMPDVVKDIDESHVDEISKCQRALSYWKDHSNEPNVWSLVDALRASNCDIVADMIVALGVRQSKRY